MVRTLWGWRLKVSTTSPFALVGGLGDRLPWLWLVRCAWGPGSGLGPAIKPCRMATGLYGPKLARDIPAGMWSATSPRPGAVRPPVGIGHATLPLVPTCVPGSTNRTLRGGRTLVIRLG